LIEGEARELVDNSDSIAKRYSDIVLLPYRLVVLGIYKSWSRGWGRVERWLSSLDL